MTVNNVEIGDCRPIGTISFVREKFMQNRVRVVECDGEEVVVFVSSQLRRRAGIVAGVETEADKLKFHGSSFPRSIFAASS